MILAQHFGAEAGASQVDSQIQLLCELKISLSYTAGSCLTKTINDNQIIKQHRESETSSVGARVDKSLPPVATQYFDGLFLDESLLLYPRLDSDTRILVITLPHIHKG